MGNEVLVINESDNVAVALRDIPKGTRITLPDGRLLEAARDIPYSHKVALEPVPEGGPVRKYGEVIGLAAEDIAPGEWVHTHNIRDAGVV